MIAKFAPNVFTIPNQAEAMRSVSACGGSSGQGDLIRELAKLPLAVLERDTGRPWRRMDHIHLSRYDGTDYYQWYGRCADGFHRPIGRIMRIVSVAGSESSAEKTRAEVAALFDIERFTCDDCPRKYECQWAFDAYNTEGDCLADK